MPGMRNGMAKKKAKPKKMRGGGMAAVWPKKCVAAVPWRMKDKPLAMEKDDKPPRQKKGGDAKMKAKKMGFLVRWLRKCVFRFLVFVVAQASRYSHEKGLKARSRGQKGWCHYDYQQLFATKWAFLAQPVVRKCTQGGSYEPLLESHGYEAYK